jgi:hypothetical protein
MSFVEDLEDPRDLCESFSGSETCYGFNVFCLNVVSLSV